MMTGLANNVLESRPASKDYDKVGLFFTCGMSGHWGWTTAGRFSKGGVPTPGVVVHTLRLYYGEYTMIVLQKSGEK